MRRRRIIIESVEPIADGSQQPPRSYLNIPSAKLFCDGNPCEERDRRVAEERQVRACACCVQACVRC